MYFTTHWQLLERKKHIIRVQVTLLDESGRSHTVSKYYEEWIGVCTDDIEKVADAIRRHFPNHKVAYRSVGRARKVLPYFEERLARDKLDYVSKPFYKVYTSASHKNVGKFFDCYKIGYYDPDEWLSRIYIDLCSRDDAYSFYYKWYEIDEGSPGLMESFRMVPDRRDPPDWTVAAFDIESVPLVGKHMPIGYLETDRIVMISVYKWNGRQGVRKWILYLLPHRSCHPISGYEEGAFHTESELLIEFHALLDDAQILTGYNINAFDLPCIFARLVWLKLTDPLGRYTSARVGPDTVVSYDRKMTLDLYTYFKTFSNYDLPSFKLDDVARVKLGGEDNTKLPVKATGIWSWYRNADTIRENDLLHEDNVERCFDLLRPETVSNVLYFGTFCTYLEYCLRDSELVYRLFEKESVASFFVERANFSALNAVEALHLGNSRVLLELCKTYGLRLGYFVNPRFFRGFAPHAGLIPEGEKYQGALNFGTPEKAYVDVSAMDYASMYPVALLNKRLCYGTTSVMTREEYEKLDLGIRSRLTIVPLRNHSAADLTRKEETSDHFSYPTVTDADSRFIVVYTSTEGFLPRFVKHFLDMRRHHKESWKTTRDVYHHNVQLGIKILLNSLYGVMASKDSPLAYLPIAMSITTLARYQLLGSFHYLKNRKHEVCYADTDSLMVCDWSEDHCDEINAFLNMPYVKLEYEQRMARLLVLSMKRYVYERSDDHQIVIKGFQKKVNGLIRFMTEKILKNVWHALFEDSSHQNPEHGWIVWVQTIQEAHYQCRDPKKYSIYRKIKNLEEYTSESCPAVRYLKKYPDRQDEYVEFTYSRADVAHRQALNWIMDAEECEWVNFEQLFISQKRIFCLLLNMTYWHLPDPVRAANTILNNLRWKQFVHAELHHWHATGRYLNLMVETGVRYTFSINDHLINERRKPGRKRKKLQI